MVADAIPVSNPRRSAVAKAAATHDVQTPQWHPNSLLVRQLILRRASEAWIAAQFLSIGSTFMSAKPAITLLVGAPEPVESCEPKSPSSSIEIRYLIGHGVGPFLLRQGDGVIGIAMPSKHRMRAGGPLPNAVWIPPPRIRRAQLRLAPREQHGRVVKMDVVGGRRQLDDLRRDACASSKAPLTLLRPSRSGNRR